MVLERSPELTLEKENQSDLSDTFLDIHINISNSEIEYNLYEKRSTPVVQFPYHLPSKFFYFIQP